ncbi:MAG TPA: SusC/RagA family TonB-linked outer membrane protein [Gemmatimonadaceae bacterium]
MARQCRTLFAIASALALLPALAAAQGTTIRGRVTSAAGAPLGNANVFLVGMNVGALTQGDGTYSFTVPAARVNGQRATLTARLIGFREDTASVTLNPGTITHDFTLTANPLRLGEVVVTGEGTATTRERLGNVINTVDSTAIRRSDETNVVQALAAKAPNVEINQQSGEPGASSYIRIRGLKTITGEGQPLFVVDGTPIDNSTIVTSTSLGGTAAPNRASDIDPNDIQSVEILKGAAAAAIYGARAAEGVVLITTKHGRPGQTRFSLRSSLRFDDVNKGIPLQTTFGHGTGGVTPACDASNTDTAAVLDCRSTGSSFGAPLPPGTPVFDHFDELFHTGNTWDNTLSLSGGGDRTQYYFSAGRSSQRGVIVGPNDFYDRTTVRLNATQALLDNLRVGANISYVDDRGSYIQKGSNTDGLLLGGLRTPPEFNNQLFLDPTSHLQRSYRFPFPSLSSATESRLYDNPFFIINQQQNTQKVGRAYGNVNVDFDPFSWLTIKETLGGDYASDQRIEALPLTSAAEPDGQVIRANFITYQIDQNLVATASHTFSPGFDGSLTVGQNLNSRSYQQNYITGITLVAPQPLNILNTINWTPNDAQSLVHGESYFGQATASLFNQLYLTAAARNDGYSTFGTSSRRHWFPKASVAWTFTNLLGGGGQNRTGWLTFGKLRASYGEAGAEPGVYSTDQVYLVGANLFDAGWGPLLLENQAGNGGLVQGTQKAQPDLGPERTKEIEAGVDLGLFNNIADAGITLYNDRSEGVIFQAPLPNSTGFISQAQNAATIRNRGIEVTFNVRPIQHTNLGWDIGLQFAKNDNRVLSLSGQQFVDLGSTGIGQNFTSNGSFTGAVATAWLGEQVGVLRGNDFARCGRGLGVLQDNTGQDIDVGTLCQGKPSGALVVDATGFPFLDPTDRVIMNGNPDWTGSVRSSVRFQKITVSGLLDIKKGGQIWNGTRGALINFGTHKDTEIRGQIRTFGKDFMPGAVVGPGAGTPVVIDENWYEGLGSGFGPVSAQFIEPGGYVKLREIAVAYTFDQPFVQHTLGLSSIDLRLSGRNLVTWTRYTGIDPETNLSGALAAIQGIDYFNNPQTRSFVITVGLNR